jgi:hypothetical protein
LLTAIPSSLTTAIMLGARFLWGALALGPLVGALHSQSESDQRNLLTYTQPSSADECAATCKNIAKSMSSASKVFYPGEFSVHLGCHVVDHH